MARGLGRSPSRNGIWFISAGGNNFNDFPENQLTKSRAVYTVKANRGPKFCRYSFTQDSSRVMMITEGRTELILINRAYYKAGSLNRTVAAAARRVADAEGTPRAKRVLYRHVPH